MVLGSKKKRAHPETSTSPATTFTPRALASIPLGMSASPARTSTLPATLTPFPQLSYSSLMPISTPSLSSATGTSSRPTPSLSVRPPAPPMQGIVGSRILILLTANSTREWARHLHNQSSEISGAKGERGMLHIETGSPMPTDKQFIFEVADGSNKGHFCDFGLQSVAITTERQGGSSSSSQEYVSFAASYDACIKREKRLWGYMQQAQDKFTGCMTSFTSQFGVQLDSVSTLFPPFPPTDDPKIPNHQPILPPGLAHLHLCSTLILMCFVLWYL
ncbi:hypothetical protein M9H77_07339 [Catharanthus roseus]|uniref:Uncharacterized protein n=1 Tax=Catharanthus roseus TaxID=4058 RepID=A0ACC0BUW4_CATRO|nr:hypothetical protein M9H77_07339 [Catharanthus roseus]